MRGDKGIDISVRTCLVNSRTLVLIFLQCRRLTSFAPRTVGCWRMTFLPFPHTAAVAALGSLLTEPCLNADVNLADDGSRLVVADVAVKGFEVRTAVVYAPNISAEMASFFRRLAPFLDDPKRIVLVGYWNVILDPKINKVVSGASG